MLNVLTIVSYNFLPPKMGGQKCVALEYKFLAKHINLTCVTTKNNDTKGFTDFEVLNILGNGKLKYINLFYFFTLKKIVKQKKITHLIIEHPYLGWLGLLLKWFCGVKFIVRSQNIEALRFKSINKWWWKILWHYEKYVHQNADSNWFITDIDQQYAIKNYKLHLHKSPIITYGFELMGYPSQVEKNISKKIVTEKYNLNGDEVIMFFNGTLTYKPNQDALDVILKNINPVLQTRFPSKYKIIICGKSLPLHYNNLLAYKNSNIIYAGFVDDVSVYFKATDIFINPVIEGGGIKTKIVEALGFNVSLVTTKSGAIGIPTDITNKKMITVEDGKWEDFINAIIDIDTNYNISSAFFDYFYWGNIAAKAVKTLD